MSVMNSCNIFVGTVNLDKILEMLGFFFPSLNTYQDIVFTDDKGKVYKNLLTSDVEAFFYNEGYLTWSKKNAELSPEAKEKIANALLRARNNFREVFVKDYENWIKFEAKGSFRLNRVARNLLFTYCPFSAELRAGVKDTPMFVDLVRRYEIATTRKVKRLETLYQKLEKSGGEITPELQENMDFYFK